MFHNSNIFGSCIIHILYTGCAKIKKKNNSGAKRLMYVSRTSINFVPKKPLFRSAAPMLHNVHYRLSQDPIIKIYPAPVESSPDPNVLQCIFSSHFLIYFLFFRLTPPHSPSLNVFAKYKSIISTTRTLYLIHLAHCHSNDMNSFRTRYKLRACSLCSSFCPANPDQSCYVTSTTAAADGTYDR